MGPLHWQILLPIALLRPIIFLIRADDAQDGPITSVDAAADGFASAHYFSKALPMLSVVPIALVNAAANGFTLIPNMGHKYALDTAGFLSNKMFPWTCHFL